MNRSLLIFKVWEIYILIHKFIQVLAWNTEVRQFFAFNLNHMLSIIEGNLGIRGMALFFSTHECNPICSRLHLTPFDLSADERQRQFQQHSLSPSYASAIPAQTACRGSEEPLNSLSKFGSLFRQLRSQSSISEDDSEGYVSETSSITTATTHQSLSSSITKLKMPILTTSISMSTPSPVRNFINCMKIVMFVECRIIIHVHIL